MWATCVLSGTGARLLGRDGQDHQFGSPSDAGAAQVIYPDGVLAMVASSCCEERRVNPAYLRRRNLRRSSLQTCLNRAAPLTMAGRDRAFYAFSAYIVPML